MLDWIVPALLLLNLFMLAWLLARRPPVERMALELRQEVHDAARGTRQELATTLSAVQQALLAQSGDALRTQNEQIDSFRTQLAQMQQAVAGSLQQTTLAVAQQGQGARDAQDAALRSFSQTMAEQLRALADANERRLAEVRSTVESRLSALQDGNEKKLEQMRATVDEKLHATLEQRLGESFKQVADRLEQVHRGLGEMQTLARDVGSLSRVLNNVKTRGTLGEVQLAALLEQVFTPEQYAANVETVPGTSARVDFAIRLPGRALDGQPVWLPIDCKFPRDDYERLLDAQQHADAPGAEAAAKAIENRLRLEARSIRDKYVATPHTTDFGILFVPTEGLYAEALRRPGLVEALQREHRIILAGPTTLLATLTSLQMGFRSLALERRSAEVWDVLGAVKTEFDKFGRVLSRVKDQTRSVLNTIDQAETRTRQMTRALKGVESMPDDRAQTVLEGWGPHAPAVAASQEATLQPTGEAGSAQEA
jgi:DNA recombination protein RmuC